MGIGAVGAVVPGLPTTVFLLIASWCFVRSCPWLEEKLLRNRFFAPYMRFSDGRDPVPVRVRITAIALMWTSVSISCVLLAVRERLSVTLAVILLAAAAIGTIVILRFRRAKA